MKSGSYSYRSFASWSDETMAWSYSPDIHETMASCELLADLGDEFSWQLVFELAGQIDDLGVVADYQKGWRNRRAMRNYMRDSMRTY